MRSSVTRRGLVCAAPAAVVVAAALAIPKEGPDARLLALGAQLEAVHAERAVFDAAAPEADDDELYERHWQLREAINQEPATTAAGIQVKARAVRMAGHYDQAGEFEGDGSFRNLSRSLVDDLLAMSKGALDA